MPTLPDTTFTVLANALINQKVAECIYAALRDTPGISVPISPVTQQIFKGPTEALNWRVRNGAESSETYPWPMPHQGSSALASMGKETYEHPIDETTRQLKEWPVYQLDASNGFVIETNTEEAVAQNQAALESLFARLPWTGARLEIVGRLCLNYFRNPGRAHTLGTALIPIHLTGVTPNATIIGCDPDNFAVEFSSAYGDSNLFDNEMGCVQYDNFAITGRPKGLKIDGSGGQFSCDNIRVLGCSVLEDELATPKQFDRTQYAVELKHIYGNGIGRLYANYNRCHGVYIHECNAISIGMIQALSNSGKGIVIKHCRDLSGHVHAEYNYDLNFDFENTTGVLGGWHEGHGRVGGYYAANTDEQPEIEPGARMVMCAGSMQCDHEVQRKWDLDAHSMRLVKFPPAPEHDNGCAFLVTTDHLQYWPSSESDPMAASLDVHWLNGDAPDISYVSQGVYDITVSAAKPYEPLTTPTNLYYTLNPGWTATSAAELEIGDLLELQITITPQNQDTWDFVLANEIVAYFRADPSANYYRGTDQTGELLPATRYQTSFKWRGSVERPAVLTVYAQATSAAAPSALLQFPYGLTKTELAALAPTGEETHVYRVTVTIAKVHR